MQSTSKLFTATLILKAVQSGLVDLDEPISTYLPEFTVRSVFDEKPERLITVRHLLSHTAGFTHDAPIGSNFDLNTDDFEQHCQSISNTWLRFPVGHHHEYSNLGIDLAGYILQRLTCKDFREHAKTTLLEPLGLTRSTFDAHVFESDEDRAVGHWRPFTRAGVPLPSAVPMVAAGGLYSCLDDALRFVQFQLRDGEGLIARDLLVEQRTMQFPLPGQRFGHGLAVYVDQWLPDVRVLHHGGSGFGYQVQLWWLPDHGLGGAVLTNSFDHSFQNELAAQITEGLAGVSGSVSRTTSQSSPESEAPTEGSAEDESALLGEYVGRYYDDRRVEREGARLMMRHDGHVSGARVVGPRTIEVDGGQEFLFSGERDGKPRYLHALRDGQTWYRNCADDSSGSASALPTGTYVAHSMGVPLVWYRLDHDSISPVIERVRVAGEDGRSSVPVRLQPIGPGLFLSAVGEVLELSATGLRYSNIELTKAKDE